MDEILETKLQLRNTITHSLTVLSGNLIINVCQIILSI